MQGFFGPIYDDWRGWAIPTFSISLYVITVFFTIRAQRRGGAAFQTIMVVIAGAWAVVVPAAFSFEYYAIWKWPPGKMPSMEAFKYSQELAKNTWIAALAFLAVLHTNILPRPEKTNDSVKEEVQQPDEQDSVENG